MRCSGWLGGVAAVLSVLGCGSDDPPRPQTAFYLSLTTGAAGQCRLPGVHELPDGARDTAIRGITSANGGVRLVDGGEDQITCSVTSLGDGSFDVDLRLSSGAIANFSASGTLVKDEARSMSVSIAIGGSGGAFSQRDCMATARYLAGGAVWIDNVSCPDMRQMSSPGSCAGTGALIFENCGT